MDLVNKLDKLSITYFKIFCHIFNKKIQVGVPLGLIRGMTQNRNFFFFSVSRLKSFIFRHFSDQKHDFEPIPYPAYCKFNYYSQFFAKKFVQNAISKIKNISIYETYRDR